MTRPRGAASKPVTRSASRSEVDRLGRRGSYRLGGFEVPGARRPTPPQPLRPEFLRREHNGTVGGWLLAVLAATGSITAAAALGVWFMPFLVGLVTGLMMRWGGAGPRVTVPAVAIMTAAGWGLALWAFALHGLPVGVTARAIATAAGLPSSAVLVLAITLAVSVAQGMAGLWLGRALTPRRSRD